MLDVVACRFISDHGGHTNAFTAAEDTNYQFDVNWDALPEALDRCVSVCSSSTSCCSGRQQQHWTGWGGLSVKQQQVQWVHQWPNEKRLQGRLPHALVVGVLSSSRTGMARTRNAFLPLLPVHIRMAAGLRSSSSPR